MAKKIQTPPDTPPVSVVAATPQTPPRQPVAPVAPIDYSTWLTKKQAAETIGVSTKAIERYVHRKKLEQRFRRQPGRSDVVVFHPEDVARLARTRRPEPVPFVMPEATENGQGQQLARVAPAADDLLRRALVAVGAIPAKTTALFLTLPEASAVSGLTQAYLRRLIAKKKLRAIRDVGWRIRRRDLEAL
jgi:hypothetical protein